MSYRQLMAGSYLCAVQHAKQHAPHAARKKPGMPARPAPPPDTYVATCLFGEYENTEGYERDLYSLIPMLHFAQDFACYKSTDYSFAHWFCCRQYEPMREGNGHSPYDACERMS